MEKPFKNVTITIPKPNTDHIKNYDALKAAILKMIMAQNPPKSD